MHFLLVLMFYSGRILLRLKTHHDDLVCLWGNYCSTNHSTFTSFCKLVDRSSVGVPTYLVVGGHDNFVVEVCLMTTHYIS